MPQQDFFRYCTSHSINHCSDFGLHSMRCISTVKCSILISNLILSNWIQRRSLSYSLSFEIFILEVIWSFLPRKSVSKVFYSRMYWFYTRSVESFDRNAKKNNKHVTSCMFSSSSDYWCEWMVSFMQISSVDSHQFCIKFYFSLCTNKNMKKKLKKIDSIDVDFMFFFSTMQKLIVSLRISSKDP